jgi:hypothetical protein
MWLSWCIGFGGADRGVRRRDQVVIVLKHNDKGLASSADEERRGLRVGLLEVASAVVTARERHR